MDKVRVESWNHMRNGGLVKKGEGKEWETTSYSFFHLPSHPHILMLYLKTWNEIHQIHQYLEESVFHINCLPSNCLKPPWPPTWGLSRERGNRERASSHLRLALLIILKMASSFHWSKWRKIGEEKNLCVFLFSSSLYIVLQLNSRFKITTVFPTYSALPSCSCWG